MNRVAYDGRCPKCHSDDVWQSSSLLAEDDGFVLFCSCRGCGSTWYERLRVVGYDSLNSGELSFLSLMRGEATCVECGLSVSVPLDARPEIWANIDECGRHPNNVAAEYAQRYLHWTYIESRGYCPLCSPVARL